MIKNPTEPTELDKKVNFVKTFNNKKVIAKYNLEDLRDIYEGLTGEEPTGMTKKSIMNAIRKL